LDSKAASQHISSRYSTPQILSSRLSLMKRLSSKGFLLQDRHVQENNS